MKKILLSVAAVFASNLFSFAADAEKDSIKVVNIDEVFVIATRATQKTPVAFTNVSSEEIKKANFGQDIPYLLGMTPSAITTSDAGTGIGYTTFRVRGTDGTRINVTANGVPMNDAESHTLFWVNMPDFASSVKSIQVQRGAGTSTNGSGAFGASINMATESSSPNPFAEFNAGFGTFNTHKETIKFGTGLINNHWSFEGRLSNIGTDGYIDRASVNLYSYLAQAGYYDDKTSLRFIIFGGKEKTYHAWYYASKQKMEKYGRRYNPCGIYYDENGNIKFYDDQTDNYIQTNYQILLNRVIDNNWSLNAALHYTRGDGYYQEYKSDIWFQEYGLNPFKIDGKDIYGSDLVRQKKMANDFGGAVFSLNYRNDRLSAVLGGGLNNYDGDHFGKVIWIKNYIGFLDPSHEYYRNHSTKFDGNIYLKANYDITSSLSAFTDLQYRHIRYSIHGANDKYDWSNSRMQSLAVKDDFNFFNPKFGLNWQIDMKNRLYASFSVAQKEPTRNNYTDSKFATSPRSERLNDYELGYVFANRWMSAGANLYYMDYKDQLVLTGQLNEIGEPMAENMPNSYRKGIELMLGVKPCNMFEWNINATISRNRIKNFTETIYEDENKSKSQWVINHKSANIAFSPDFLLNNQFTFSAGDFMAMLQSQYVGKQYMSNANQNNHLLDSYFVSNLHLSYTFKTNTVKAITLGLSINNLFNEEYENNGYAGSGFYMDDNNNKVRYNYAGYAAQAGTNVMCNISLRF